MAGEELWSKDVKKGETATPGHQPMLSSIFPQISTFSVYFGHNSSRRMIQTPNPILSEKPLTRATRISWLPDSELVKSYEAWMVDRTGKIHAHLFPACPRGHFYLTELLSRLHNFSPTQNQVAIIYIFL